MRNYILNIRSNIVWGLLMVFACINTAKWAAGFFSEPYHPLDFRTYYTASGVYWQGNNPYQIHQIQRYWIKDAAYSDWPALPNPQHSLPVYLPQFVFYFGFYNLIGYHNGAILQLLLNACSLALMAYCISRINSGIKWYMALTAILAFRGTWYAMDNGQPMLQAAALILLSLYLIIKRQQTLLPGILLGLAAFKFTLLLAPGLYLLLSKRYKPLLLMAGTALVLNILAIFTGPQGLNYLPQLLSNMNNLWAYPHLSVNELSALGTSISVPLAHWGILNTGALQMLMPILLLLLFAGIILFSGRFRSEEQVLYIAALCGFCFGQFMLYDLLLLPAYRLLYTHKEDRIRIQELILLVLLLLPLGRITEITGLAGMHYALQLMLFVVLVFELAYLAAKKYRPAKNAS